MSDGSCSGYPQDENKEKIVASMIWHGMDTEFEELYALSLIPKMCQNYIHRQVHLLFFGSLGSLHGATICAPAVFAYGKSYSILYVRVRFSHPALQCGRFVRGMWRVFSRQNAEVVRFHVASLSGGAVHGSSLLPCLMGSVRRIALRSSARRPGMG